MSNAPGSLLCETAKTALFRTSAAGSSCRTRRRVSSPRAPRAFPSQNVTFFRTAVGCVCASRRSNDASAAASRWRAIAAIAPSATRLPRARSWASDSSIVMLSAGRTPFSQMTFLPPASSAQSGEKMRMRSTCRSATRRSTAMWSGPSSLIGCAGCDGGADDCELRSVASSLHVAQQSPRPPLI